MTDEEGVKKAFERVKEDIFTIGNELLKLKTEFFDLKNQITYLKDSLDSIKLNEIQQKNAILSPTHNPTDALKNPTNPNIPTHNPTHPVEIGGLKTQNLRFSTGNGGVPTDRQTNQQTDKSTYFQAAKPLKMHLEDAKDIIDSLDAVRKEIRLKFKQITNQEMLIFSTIYQLEADFPDGVEYRQIAKKLKLSESSIRDYCQKLINKGIPIDKIKLNNKKILLKISYELKNITSLQTLIKLREL